MPAYFEKYCMYKVQIDCDDCGNPVPIDGPCHQAECPSCLSKAELNAGFWGDVINDLRKEYRTLDWDYGSRTQTLGEFNLKMTYARQVPKCRECRLPLPLETIVVGFDGPMTCVKCGTVNHTRPAPDWFKKLFGDARQLFCVPAVEGGEQPVSDPTALRPVLMACMNCGGKLEVTHESARILNCEYCDSDHWLPEQLWRRMHPAKKKTPWYVCFGDSDVPPDYVPDAD